MTAFEFAHAGCSWCHPGGGPLEYDRQGYRYDGAASGLLASADVNPMKKNGDYFVFGMAAGADASSYAGAGFFEVSGTKGILDPASAEGVINLGTSKWVSNGTEMKLVGKKYNTWTSGGVAEADCLMCHYANQYSQVDRNWAAPGYTMPKWSASLGLVGAKGQTGLLTPGAKAGEGINPALGTPSWSSNMVTSNMIVKAPRNEACSVCHFFDNAFTNKGPAGKPMGNTAWQKKIAAGSFPDGDIGPSHASYANGNSIVDWVVAKGKPEGGKRSESINDNNNPDAHMKWPAYSGTGAEMTCSVCHYNLSGTFPALMHGADTIYPAITVQKIDHQFAKGDNLPDGKNMDQLDNTVTCASCHTDGTHPNKGDAPIPGHAGFPALHFAKLDCRVCHIPVVNAKSIWKVADYTVGPYRTFERNQAPENPLGSNAKPLLIWRKSSTSDTIKLEPVNTTVVPVWTDNSSIKPVYQRVAKSAAEAKRAADGFNTETNIASFALNTAQGGDTTLIVNTTAEITDMVSRINSGAGISTAVMHFYINTFDISHNVMPKGGKCIDRNSDGDTLDAGECNYILGSAEGGGCVMCHSSSNPSSAGYSAESVGFFDRTHTLFTPPTQTDPACSNTQGMHQTTIDGVKRVAVKFSTIKSDGGANTIDLSDVADCAPVGNTLDQGAVLGYPESYRDYLMSMMTITTAVKPSLSKPMARIAYRVTGKTVVFDGRQSINADAYSWNFGDLTSASTGTAEKTYANAGAYIVTLTVTSSDGLSSTVSTKVVTQENTLNTAPTASIGCTISGNTVTCTDASTRGDGADVESELKIRINWGDGGTSLIARGAPSEHTYADGTYTVYSSATGSTSRRTSTNESKFGPFTLPGGLTLGTIYGTITDGLSSAPVATVTVNFYRDVVSTVTGNTVEQLYSATTTTGAGTYSVALPNGEYKVRARKNGMSFTTADSALVSSGSTTDRDFKATHTLSGRIAGAPSGVPVEVTNGVPGTIGTAQTAANGSFTVVSSLLTSGTYTVTPQPTSGSVSPASINVTVDTADYIISNGTFTYTP